MTYNVLMGTLNPTHAHRRIADEYYGGATVTKFPTKYFRIEFMRREFVVRVIGTLLVVLYLPYNILVNK